MKSGPICSKLSLFIIKPEVMYENVKFEEEKEHLVKMEERHLYYCSVD